ncbi:helix-turn-helix domain-containing protein [Cystobacter ferrugineus]|uniref:Helix-turn-helix domain-containing protein n=1 Tax=Cystobacter ferrugineus TaxID=83449 RepID=A0A1L9BFN3_9BACT|nr:helix-turn-helix domain-containing protein [Cystobacter ferrugineus]OJH41016.1 hypothetical protein BON30_08905 [Cystobacter ferrugineus]
MSNNPEPLWKVQDVARFLSLSTSWVYKEAEAGRLPCVRIGAALRFHPEEIRAFLERQRVPRGSVTSLRR